MLINFDITRTLMDLEGGVNWGSPTFHSNLVARCHELRHKPLQDFSISDLRIMIGQEISLNYLVPIAIEALADNPFAEGGFYKGDLLGCVLKIDPLFWQQHPVLKDELDSIINEAKTAIEMLLPLVNEYTQSE